MSFLRFLGSKTFLYQILILLLVVVVAVYGFLKWADYYTMHGYELNVPDLKGYSLFEAESELQRLELKSVVLDSSEYYPDKPILSVISQYPAPGAKVKPGKEIKLTVNPSGPRLVKVPNLVERSRRRAIYDLESKGFRLGRISYVPYIGRDMVVAAQHNGRELSSNDYLPKGSVIDLVVGLGLDNELIEVPYLLGKNFATVKNILLSRGLNLGFIAFDYGTDTAKAFVYRQEPMPSLDKTIMRGSEISIWLTTDNTKMPVDSLTYFSNLVTEDED
ncbi:MAG: PASTA domain-containing protein [Thermaurantimonas sp.]|uniref:PASTA domain-containing protein n=1 Tax=Thermaurantimonas sp. TaxID=2681568 RepID=UPI003918AE7B